jgi:hypothetical protein
MYAPAAALPKDIAISAISTPVLQGGRVAE